MVGSVPVLLISHTREDSIMSKREITKLDQCRHCIIGKIILETEEMSTSAVSEIRMGGENPTRTVLTCYCSNCGTLFHAPTYLKKLAEKTAIR